ncbi:hypothetical protein kaaroe_140 [Escherichia phage kaaroe]|uniref:Uncharacterized protein n=1 Tax=Escherichia phage kaaroe TaxID=2696412 RepID=A0A6B9WNC8_9CAUD|nr:hypothetical protein kaaroe_140 [Escherichia phage kaaroe]
MKRMSLKEQMLFILQNRKLCHIPFDYIKDNDVMNYRHGIECIEWYFVLDKFVDDVIRRKLAFDVRGDLVYLDGKKTAKNPVTVYALQQYLTAYIGLKYTHSSDKEAEKKFIERMLKIQNEHAVNP